MEESLTKEQLIDRVEELEEEVFRLKEENARLKDGRQPIVCCPNTDDLSDCAMIYQLDSYLHSLDKIAEMVPRSHTGGTIEAVKEELDRLKAQINNLKDKKQ